MRQYRCGQGCKQWGKKIKNCGYRFTLPRQIILDALYKSCEHLSAEEIYNKIHKKHPEIGFTTVYRTLDLLVKLGILHKFDFGDDRARYELVDSENAGIEHHHHLVCENCGKIIDYSDFIDEEKKLIEKMEKHLSQKHNFKINKHILQFYGICKNCKQ